MGNYYVNKANDIFKKMNQEKELAKAKYKELINNGKLQCKFCLLLIEEEKIVKIRNRKEEREYINAEDALMEIKITVSFESNKQNLNNSVKDLEDLIGEY